MIHGAKFTTGYNSRRRFLATVFSTIIAGEQTLTIAFNHDVKSRPFLLDSLASVAQSGASVWSNHVSIEEADNMSKKPTNLKQASSIYVSQLYKRIKKSRQGQELNIDRDDVNSEDVYAIEDTSTIGRTSHWPEHFFEEIIAYIAGGAAATSAFSAVIAGTIFATAVVTVGAIASAFIFGDVEDSSYYIDTDGMNDQWIKSDAEINTNNRDCDLDDGFFEEKSSVSLGHDQAFHDSTLRELQKCFAGKPSTNTLSFTEPSSSNTCSRQLPQYDLTGFGVDTDFPVYEIDAISNEVCGACSIQEQSTAQAKLEQPKMVELIWHDSYSTAASSYYTSKMNARRRRSNMANRKVTISSDQSFDLEETEREGAILLSDTFRVTSSAFGLLADAVRFAGESTAATAGGTARLVGGAIRAGGWAVGSLGSAIASDKSTQDDSTESSSRIRKHGAKHVAGTSVKLLGDAIDNVAESLFLAGSATERIAFAAAGAAEGAVRIFEDFTSSLSNTFAREGRKGTVASKPSRIAIETRPVITADDAMADTTSLISSDLVDEEVDESTELNANEVVLEDDFMDEISEYLLRVSTWTLKNVHYIMQDTAGVSSNAPQLLLVLVMMYFASLILLRTSAKFNNSSEIDVQMTVKPEQVVSNNKKSIPEGITADDGETHSTLTIDSTMRRDPGTHLTHVGTGVAKWFVWLAFFPLKLFWLASVRCCRIIFSRRTALLAIHILGWFVICQMTQIRSDLVERKAMLVGYKNAVDSAGTSLASDQLESAFWLNSIISRIWRIDRDQDSIVGGLEPLLASSVSSILAKSLEESYSRPTGVAHVSLASLTFGKSPPIVRDIEIKGVDAKEANVHLGLDVIMLLEDAALMLDIKPSSLEYKMVPSTKVAIYSLDLQISIDLSIQATPDYPYISLVNISLSEIPDFSLRIVPQQESGLKGIDFGSFPLISKWVKEVINSSIVEYITPHYVSLNIPAWIMGQVDGEEIVNYF